MTDAEKIFGAIAAIITTIAIILPIVFYALYDLHNIHVWRYITWPKYRILEKGSRFYVYVRGAKKDHIGHSTYADALKEIDGYKTVWHEVGREKDQEQF